MIRYRIEQDTKSDGLWISADIFEAATLQQVRQNVIAGFTSEARRAVCVDVPGRILYGLDSKGKAL